MIEDTVPNKMDEVFRPLIRRETDVIANMRQLVEKAKDFIALEESTGRVIILNRHYTTNQDKIALILIGRFFANYAGFAVSKAMGLSQLCEELNVPATTLSAPLGDLVKASIIKRTGHGEYEIASYNIEDFLTYLRTARGMQ